MGGFAWVTLATNDSYSLGALVLAHSLKQAGTAHRLAVLVTPGVTNSMRQKLAGVFDLVEEVNVLDSKDEANLRLLKRPELGITFTKLHCWRLTQFEKCIFLDADTLVLQNADELFERDEFSAAPDVGWPDCFNSGVFVYRPSNETYDKLVQFALSKGSFDGGDQGLLNLYFNEWAHKDISKHLPFIYNMCSTACYSYLPAFKQFGTDVKIVHFIGNTKPWMQLFNSESKQVEPGHDMQHLKTVLQAWWDIFCSLVHSNLSTDMNATPTVAHYLIADSTSTDCFYQPSDYRDVWDPWEDYVVKNDDAKSNISDKQFESHNTNSLPHRPHAFDNIASTIRAHTTPPPHTPPSESVASPQEFVAQTSTAPAIECVDSNTTNLTYCSMPDPTVVPISNLNLTNDESTSPLPEPRPEPVVPTSKSFDSIASNENRIVPVPISDEPVFIPNIIPIIQIEFVHCSSVGVEAKEECTTTDVEDYGGLAGAFAQFSLGSPRPQGQSELEDHLRRQSWEVGNIDYMGRDAFDKIWSKISETIASPPDAGTKEAAASASPTEAAAVAAPAKPDEGPAKEEAKVAAPAESKPEEKVATEAPKPTESAPEAPKTEVAVEAKPEVPKPEEPQADLPKTEEIKCDTTKVEAAKPEEAKPEEPKVDAPKTDEPKLPEPPKAEEVIPEVPKVEEIKAEEPKAEAPKAEVATPETPKPEKVKRDVPKAEDKPETPKAEEVKSEAPQVTESKPEVPKAEEPKVEAPKVEEPKQDAPKEAEPASEAPKAEENKFDVTKPEEVKSEAPKAEEPKPEVPKAEEQTPEVPKADEQKPEVSKAEEPKPETREEAPKVEEVKPEAPKPEEVKPQEIKSETEVQKTEETKAETSKPEEPKPSTEATKVEETKAEAPKTEETKVGDAKTDKPVETPAVADKPAEVKEADKPTESKPCEKPQETKECTTEKPTEEPKKEESCPLPTECPMKPCSTGECPKETCPVKEKESCAMQCALKSEECPKKDVCPAPTECQKKGDTCSKPECPKTDTLVEEGKPEVPTTVDVVKTSEEPKKVAETCEVKKEDAPKQETCESKTQETPKVEAEPPKTEVKEPAEKKESPKVDTAAAPPVQEETNVPATPEVIAPTPPTTPSTAEGKEASGLEVKEEVPETPPPAAASAEGVAVPVPPPRKSCGAKKPKGKK